MEIILQQMNGRKNKKKIEQFLGTNNIHTEYPKKREKTIIFS